MAKLSPDNSSNFQHLPITLDHTTDSFKELSDKLRKVLDGTDAEYIQTSIHFVPEHPDNAINVVFTLLHNDEHLYFTANADFNTWVGRNGEMFPDYKLNSFSLKRYGVAHSSINLVDTTINYLFNDSKLRNYYKNIFDSALADLRKANVSDLSYGLAALLDNPNDY